mgnify:CR=1 FL=1
MANVYVSKSGNDSKAGEINEPILTLTKGFEMLDASGSGPHQLIIKDAGVYQEGNLGETPTLARDNVTIMAETGSDGRPLLTPTIRGSGSAGVQARAFFCDDGWLFFGLKFDNFIISNGNGIIEARNINGSPITVQDCIFTEITGTCIDFSAGSSDPGLHVIQRNKFHEINIPSASNTNTIDLGASAKKAKIINNVFYDIQFRNDSSRIINLGGTRGPENIISHNVFGTSSTEQAGDPDHAIVAKFAKFEYNIMTGYDNDVSFIDNEGGESNFNIFFNITGSGTNAPFGGSSGPTQSVNNQSNVDALFKGPLVGSSANYRLRGTSSPAFDAAVGSADVTTDFTGVSRATLDQTAFASGVFDIGAFEITGLFQPETVSSSADIGDDFIIKTIPNAQGQYRKGSASGNPDIFGKDVDQVPMTSAVQGPVPGFIRGGNGRAGGVLITKD